MTLIREIPRNAVTQSQLICLAEAGFILRERGDVIQVFAQEMATA